MEENKNAVVVKPGLDFDACNLDNKCSVCECEYKFALNSVEVTRSSNDPAKHVIHCPWCKEANDVPDVYVKKYRPILIRRERHFPSTDF